MATCTFVIILFRLFYRLFINLTMRVWALFPKPPTALGLQEQAFWKMPSFTEWVIASSSKVILARPSRHSTTGTLTSETSGSRWFSLICCIQEFGDGFNGVTLPRLFISWRKLQLSPFAHWPLVSHCQQSPRILCTRCFVPWFLTAAFFSKFPFRSQNSYFEFSARYFFSP